MSNARKLLLEAEKFLKLAEEEPEPITVRNPVPATPPPSLPESQRRFFEALRIFGHIPIENFLEWLRVNSAVTVMHRPLPEIINLPGWEDEYSHDGSFLENPLSDFKSIRIYNKPSIEADVSEVTHLKGVGNIPQLWVFVGDFASSSPVTQNMDKELSHNYFIWEAFKHLFMLSENKHDIAEVSLFANQHKNVINKLRSMFSKRPILLGAGSDGIAFDVGSAVFKIFRDDVAYFAAKEALNRLHKHPELARTEAMIYDVGRLGNFRNTPLFYYTIEKMTSLDSIDESGDLKDSLRALVKEISIFLLLKNSSLKDLKKRVGELSSDALKKHVDHIVESTAAAFEGTNLISDVEGEIAQARKSSPEIPHLKTNWFPLLIEEICFKYLTDRNDLHVSNLGINSDGQFRYFDPAYSGLEGSKVHIGGGKRI